MKKITEREIEKLENSILAADRYGEDLLIKDLREQIFALTKKLRYNYGYAPRSISLIKRFEDKPATPEAKDCPYCGYFKPCEIHRPELI